MSVSTSSGPFAGESRADAWLFEHSKFLRKHFSPNGPTDIPSKHELVQERASGNAFPRETKMDTALFEHSKFLRNHVKHEENVEGGIQSKHAMLRDSFDGDRPKSSGALSEGNEAPKGLRKTMRSNAANTTTSHSDPAGNSIDVPQNDPIVAPVAAAVASSTPKDRDVVNGTDNADDIPHSTATEDQALALSAGAVPAWQAATDNRRAYGEEKSLRSAAAVGAGPGLIEHHPTTMESTPAVERPVPHSLQSNGAHARSYDEATGADPTTHAPQEHEDSVAR